MLHLCNKDLELMTIIELVLTASICLELLFNGNTQQTEESRVRTHPLSWTPGDQVLEAHWRPQWAADWGPYFNTSKEQLASTSSSNASMYSMSPNLRAALMAHLGVREALLSQFAPGCAESHCAGKAAESSTELTEAKRKAKVKMQLNRESTESTK